MFYIEILLLVLFVILLAVGYKKNNRNMMLVASLCLVLATALPSLSSGIQEGFDQTKNSLEKNR
ncbi:hypothetical protein AWR38_07625 [Idiomarina sp. WRN-38]|nr:hypothetical protein AUR68_07610 [Idiomarina sp. H105]OAE91270.1 hypothetical protein AWR38_07625 [Idiomarina sp. WRN-38]